MSRVRSYRPGAARGPDGPGVGYDACMLPRASFRPVIVGVALWAGCVGGCASEPGPQSFAVSPGGYAQAFQRAKDALRAHEFELDRVDARAGVITTKPRAWSGAATPWYPYTSTPGDAVEGLVHAERRVVEVRFVPEGGAATDPTVVDLRDESRNLSASVEVQVERVYRPLRRVDPTGVRLASFATDPALVEAGKQPLFVAAERKDERLAGRLVRSMASTDGVERPTEPGEVPPPTVP